MGPSEEPRWKVVQTVQRGVFQAKLYENIYPKNAKAIISSTHCPNRAMHEISHSVNHLHIYF